MPTNLFHSFHITAGASHHVIQYHTRSWHSINTHGTYNERMASSAFPKYIYYELSIVEIPMRNLSRVSNTVLLSCALLTPTEVRPRSIVHAHVLAMCRPNLSANSW